MPFVLSYKARLSIALWISVHQEGLAMQLLCEEEFGKLLGGSARGVPSE